MFISEAWAQAAGGAGGGGLDSLLSGPLPMFAMVGLVIYFLMIRPQSQKAKRHRELLKSLRRGDRIVTQSGMFATVAKVISDTELQVEIADGVRVRLLKSAVTEVLAKTEPLSKDKPKASGSGEAEDEAATEDEKETAANDQPVAAPPAPAPQGIAGVLAKLFGGR